MSIQDEIAKSKLKEAKDDLKNLLNSVPKTYSTWYYPRVIDFKDAVKRASRVLNNSRAKPESIFSAVSELKSYHMK